MTPKKDPEGKGHRIDRLPNWPAYAADKRAVMIFDAPCRVENDPTGVVRQMMDKRGLTGGGPLPAPSE